MTAGVYATSCREKPDRDMEAMRRWMRHAVWHGGPAADYRVLLWLGVVPRRADPVLTVLQAAGRTVSLLLEDQHFTMAQLQLLWAHPDKANPVAALRKAMLRAGVGGDLGRWTSDGRELTRPLQAAEGLRNEWFAEAQLSQDMGKVAASRPKMKLMGSRVQWPWILGQVDQLHLAADRRAALIGVMAGDAVPETTAAKWKGGEGRCRCGMVEDLNHRWWRCPLRSSLRQRALKGVSQRSLDKLPECTRQYGIPVELAAAAVAEQPADRQAGAVAQERPVLLGRKLPAAQIPGRPGCRLGCGRLHQR